ncbi:4Fe-4S binding protein, partial [bacterium]|nr:4Fe-4S binding protein [bacterium]
NLCKGCGLCVSNCPDKAIYSKIENLEETIEELQNRIKKRIDYESSTNITENKI